MSDEKNSLPSKTAFQDSKNESITGNSAPVARGGDARIDDRAGFYVAIISIILAAMSMMGFLWAYSETQEAKREAQAAKNRADVAIMRTEGFTRALIAKGIDPYPHLVGEDN